MQNFMSNRKLNCVEVGEGEEQSGKVVAVPEGKLEFCEVPHHLEEEYPIHGDRHVEAYAKKKCHWLKGDVFTAMWGYECLE